MPRRVVYNEDGQGIAEARPESAEADLRAWVDKPLSQIPIDTYAWCTALPDIVMHESRVGEMLGRRFESPPDRSSATLDALRRDGKDALRIVSDQAHRHGVAVVASVRMSDTHHQFADPSLPGVSQFLLDHLDCVIRRQDGVPETALDYSFAEVREHRLAILRELAEDYDVDGIELDFVRWGKYFARDEAPFKADIMTEFVQQVRHALDGAGQKRGRARPILGAQVLQSLYLNRLAGLDPRTWVDQGWLDYIIQCDYNCTNPQIPVEEFAEFCRPSPCTHHVRMGNMMGGGWRSRPYLTDRKTAYRQSKGYGGMVLTPAEARGAAANIYGFGADGVGLWNLCCNLGQLPEADRFGGVSREEFQQDIFAWAREVADPGNVWRGERVYHFVPIYRMETVLNLNYPVDQVRMGPLGEPVQIVCFSPRSEGFRQAYRFQTADGNGSDGLSGTLRWRILQCTLRDEFGFDLNGRPIEAARIRPQAVEDEELPYVWYEVELADCPPLRGHNELGLCPRRIVTHRPAPEGAVTAYEEYPYLEEVVVTVRPS